MNHISHDIIVNKSGTVAFKIKMPVLTGWASGLLGSLRMPASGADRVWDGD